MQRRASRQAPGQPLAVDQSILQTMNRQVDNLARMISGLLDFSAIQMGRLELQRRWFSMGELARESMEQMQVTAPSRHLHVVVDGETSVEADADRVHEVLLNLISNAIKATEPGGEIQVSVVREGQEIVVSVRDNGVGMPKDVQEHIFERLYRGGDHHQQRMGLCLFVTKGIVDAHGGRIWFESEPGKGTTFHFSLPAGSQPGR